MDNSTAPVLKPGYKTTEFYISIVAQLFGIASLVGWFDLDPSGQISNTFLQISGVITLGATSIGYSYSRAKAKAIK